MTRSRWLLLVACALLVGCDDDDDSNGSEPPPRPVQQPLPGTSIPQFAQALPQLDVAQGTLPTLRGNQPLTIRMCELWANVLPPGTLAPGVQPKTRVWGYVEGECPASGPDDPARDSYIGPVIISQRSEPATNPQPPTTITWINDLGTTDTTQVLAYTLSTDQTLHWASPDPAGHACETDGTPAFGSACAQNYAGPIPAVVHLHGGEVPPQIDGGPDAWFLSQPADGYDMHGPSYYSFGGDGGNSAVYAYPNVQEASPLWFHDHTLGVTRLNVYAGLAGAYLITDPQLALPSGLTATGLAGPNDTEVPLIPLVVQDRAFDTNGQLFYPADSAGGEQFAPNPQHPFWAPESFTDTIVVNGKAWPFVEVEPKRYRFLFLDGANARAFAMSFVQEGTGTPGPSIWIIGNEEGYLDEPVALDPAAGEKLVMLPGERYDVIVDFSGVAPGTNLILTNTANAPYPDGDAPDPATTGRVLQVRVGGCTSGCCGAQDPGYDPASGVPLLAGSDRQVRFSPTGSGVLDPAAPIAHTRMLTLNEVLLPASTAINPVTGEETAYPGGSLELLLNNTSWDGDSSRPYQDFTSITVGDHTLAYSELPTEGDAEVWEIVNLTGDAHPIHTHLTDLQLVNRQAFDVDAYTAAYGAAFPGGSYQPEFGPPLDYATGNRRALGGNPDVTPFLTGSMEPPAPYETGWKDTVVVPPGMVTRFVVRYAPSSLPLDASPGTLTYPFDPNGGRGYVWHCHIISHEDNEMMRPFQVQLNPAAPPPERRALQLGRDY